MSAVPDQLFLTEPQVDELTGIKRGQNGKSKHLMQCNFLRNNGIAHFVNARGKPVIPISAIEGRRVEPIRKTWQPKLA